MELTTEILDLLHDILSQLKQNAQREPPNLAIQRLSKTNENLARTLAGMCRPQMEIVVDVAMETRQLSICVFCNILDTTALLMQAIVENHVRNGVPEMVLKEELEMANRMLNVEEPMFLERVPVFTNVF